ncbi:MAG: hypothetical protein IPP47_30295 [Bryobacterales bacterium]|nr:hypothetical protein [Bryobacterales bacterium]
MADWEFLQKDKAEQLARVEYYSMCQANAAGEEVEFLIAVHEYLTPKDPTMKFLAKANRTVNEQFGAITPCGWGNTHSKALSACLEMIRKFPA